MEPISSRMYTNVGGKKRIEYMVIGEKKASIEFIEEVDGRSLILKEEMLSLAYEKEHRSDALFFLGSSLLR